MLDREWMLNPQAIRTAKKCIALVKEEFGEKLTLSDPMFMQSLHQYAEMSKVRALGTAYSRLLSMAGVGEVIKNLLPKADAEKQTAKVDIARSA